MKFPFADFPETAVITCRHAVCNHVPILYASHDAEDGMWQFLCGETHDPNEAMIISLQEAFELDHAIGKLKDMPCGCFAQRKSKLHRWVVQQRK